MKTGSLPRRYARALLLLAKEEGRVKEFGEELARFQAVLRSFPEAQPALGDRSFPQSQRQEALREILTLLTPSPFLRNFLSLLIQKERFLFLDEIIREYQKMEDEVVGIIRAEVITAHAPSRELLTGLKRLMGKKLGKEVVTTGKEDPEILAGLVLKIGNRVYDGSVRRELEKIREQLLQQ